MAPSTRRSCLVLLALYVCLVNYTEGATFLKPTQENPDYPGQCYDYQLKKAVPDGETITDHARCTRLRCNKSNDTPPQYTLEGASCSRAVAFPSNCRVVDGDPAADYPGCCKKVECDGPPQGPISRIG